MGITVTWNTLMAFSMLPGALGLCTVCCKGLTVPWTPGQGGCRHRTCVNSAGTAQRKVLSAWAPGPTCLPLMAGGAQEPRWASEDQSSSSPGGDLAWGHCGSPCWAETRGLGSGTPGFQSPGLDLVWDFRRLTDYLETQIFPEFIQN